MAVQRFVLDSTTLDNAGFGLAGGAAFILDTSTLDGAAVLDGGQFLTVATGSSSLGGLSASASAQATIFPVLTSSLGGLDASATARATIFPVLSSSLGGLDASASAQSTLFPVLNASLGGLDATASASAIIFPVLDAPLDGLVASATAQSVAPEPPYIPPSGSRWWKQPATPVKKSLLRFLNRDDLCWCRLWLWHGLVVLMWVRWVRSRSPPWMMMLKYCCWSDALFHYR